MGKRDTSLPGLILDELGVLIRQLTRITGGPEDGPPMSVTQRLALFETCRDGPLRLTDLAHRLGVSAPAASRAVEALVELGFVDRHADPDDRRAVRVAATEAGRRRYEERGARAAAAFGPAASEALSRAEQEQLVELLRRLATRLRA